MAFSSFLPDLRWKAVIIHKRINARSLSTPNGGRPLGLADLSLTLGGGPYSARQSSGKNCVS
jgi:hypothetical protein